MKRPFLAPKTTMSSERQSEAGTRLYGRRLVIARTVWLALVALTLGFFVAGLPAYYQQVQTPCVDPVTCNVYGALTAKGLRGLHALGFSASGYAAFNIILFVIICSVWSVIGFLIFWRRSDDWLALVAALFLVMFNLSFPGNPAYALAIIHPQLDLPIMFMSFLGQISLYFFFLLFPNGRFTPRWIGAFMLLGIVQVASNVFLLPNSPFNSNNWPGWLNAPAAFIIYGAIAFSQVYRYVRVSNPVQRQQTKWVVFGIISALGVFFGLGAFFSAFFPTFNQPDTPYLLIPDIVYPLLLLVLPISIGIAILRYRLYDIDVLINRTLVYTLLTVILALVYAGSVIALQAIVRELTGQVSQQPLVTVASTLVIAALFQPLRRRIQRVIDRRFYRRKYDAAQTLAAFSATLRNEVDLSRLSEHLLQVVQETMQPAHVSLWLRKPQEEETSPAKAWRSDPSAPQS